MINLLIYLLTLLLMSFTSVGHMDASTHIFIPVAVQHHSTAFNCPPGTVLVVGPGAPNPPCQKITPQR